MELLPLMLVAFLYEHQKKAIQEQNKHKKCLINMWCGTGKTRTFTIDLFIHNEKTNVIVFPSLGLINQYCNDYALSTDEPFKTEFEKYNCLAFCSDDDGKLKSKGKIQFTTDERKLNAFFKKKEKQIILVTYQSFEKFINICIKKNIHINNLIFDEAHHIVGDKIQDIVFNNDELDEIVDKTRFYTATPVNKNGITMYDREDPENSDCGELAYEYLYYQAVEDGICKPFETQISLYRQKPEYTNKYQPVFESIIRACLSGKYDYWNILTYHSFVNENEDMNANISFVNDFASKKNQKLVKKLFTTIQNEEFPHTKHTYSVDDVILKGVHSETHTRQQIIQNFDRKVPGRIYILASCGILNEGIDTKWANMGVPINPSKSIVKESQRIGRLVRIPEQGMPPAIILIPCEVDVTKYSSMDTAEQRDQMIREELSECGNFNTALNVISAFKYQYDPDLFEMCLKYPNMYAPKEVKDNLEKQGLIVEESQGDLLDNLKYVCEKERIDLDTESFEGENERDILKEVAELSEKTIEIHTQNHDEPVKYINEEATDEEPLRLFYCEDDKTYSPIVKKDKKQKIKRKSTTPPKKRPKLFDVHQHPDLEVLWKIKESSIDLNKTFSQGVLDVDINWNEKKWDFAYKLLDKYSQNNSKLPTMKYIFEDFKLGQWINVQITNYNKKKLSQERINKLEQISIWSWDINSSIWNNHYEKLIKYISIYKKIPRCVGETKAYWFEGYNLGSWVQVQRSQYNKNNLSEERKNKLEKIEFWYWDEKEYYWLDNYNKLKLFHSKNKRFPTQKEEKDIEMSVGWISHQRQNKKNGKLSEDKIDLLEKIPEWKWEIDKEIKWTSNYNLLKKYQRKFNKLPLAKTNFENTKLGSWCDKQRQDRKNKSLSNGRIKLLEEIPGWFWEYNFEEKWMDNYNKYKKFIIKNNDNLTETEIEEKMKMSKNWIRNQRENYDKDNLSLERIKLLEEISGWVWKRTRDINWTPNYNLLKIYENKNKKIPSQSFITDCGIKLGSWCQLQRSNRDNLSNHKIKLLEEIPKWKWEMDKEIWNEFYNLLKEYQIKNNKIPNVDYITSSCLKLGSWCGRQRTRKDKLSQGKIDLLEKIPGWYWKLEAWDKKYIELKDYQQKEGKIPVQIKKNNQTESNKQLVILGRWVVKQKQDKKKEKLSQKRINLLEQIPGWKWRGNIGDNQFSKKDMSKPEIKPKKTEGEIKVERQQRTQSELSQLHKEYKTKNSQNLNTYFKENPEKWKEYHKISKQNEESFPEEEIPRNKMIKYLEDLPGKKKKIVADLGCGFAEINKHFQDNTRFEFHNFDHISDNDMVVSRDIKNTELEDYSVDIAILSLAMWGSNCKDYLQEAYRILDTGGTVLIAEAFKRWNKELDEQGNPINRLVNLLEENNFTIIEKIESKFMFIECRKNFA